MRCLSRLLSSHPQVHAIRGSSHIPGQEQHQQQHQHQQPYGQQTSVVPHDQFTQQVGQDTHPHGLDYGQSAQTGQDVSHSRSIGEPLSQNGFAGGYDGQQQQQLYPNDNKAELSALQPSRSYSTYGQQGGQPLTSSAGLGHQNGYQQDQTLTQPDAAGVNRHHSMAPTAMTEGTTAGMAGVGAPVAAGMIPNATAVGTEQYPEQHQLQQQQQQQPMMNGQTGRESVYGQPQRKSTIKSIHTGQDAAPSVAPTGTTASPISGGGLGAALATSGHSLTSRDKKALKQEIKNEQKFEKQLASENKQENELIGVQLKLSKLSIKKAEKSAKHEAAYRKTYDKAIQREVKAKKYLVKIQNEYNKVAADLESATKEMEIRKNQHIADVQTRDADQQKLEDLRQQKGRNDVSCTPIIKKALFVS